MSYHFPMSYQRIAGMRSNRFPLMGLGCAGCNGRCAGTAPGTSGLGCGGGCAPPIMSVAGLGHALGLDVESAAFGLGIAAAGFIGLGAGWFAHGALAPRRNRGRRRRTN
jgi:hypothetical protein